MNLLPLLLPVGKQYKITTPMSVDESVSAIQTLVAVGKRGEQARRPFTGTVDRGGFVLRKRAGLFNLGRPEFRGKFLSGENGTEISITVVPSLSMNVLINGAANTMIGATIGVIVSCAMMPDAVAVSYAFVLMAVIPAIFLMFGANTGVKAMKSDSALLMERLQHVLKSAPPQVKEPQPAFGKAIFQDSIQLVLAAVLFVFMSFYVHGLVWQLWCHGRYHEVEAVTKPIAELTDKLLGPTAGATIDCHYYLAECLRSQGKLAPARAAYDKVITSLERVHPDRLAFLGDNRFGLARVLDEMGYHPEAETAYRKAIEDWSHAPTVGANNLWVSKALDRLAMVCLKENKFKDAESAMDRALKIDQAAGQKPGRSYGEDLNDMGLIYDKMEQYDKAADSYKKAIAEKERVVGKEHYSIATTCHNLGEVMQKKGDREEWRNQSLRAARIWTKYLGINFAGSRDPMQEYIEMMHHTCYEYETPNSDTRFDGMRPYLGRY